MTNRKPIGGLIFDITTAQRTTSPWIDELLRENERLRGLLYEQWKANHEERCGSQWPCEKGRECRWPLETIGARDNPT